MGLVSEVYKLVRFAIITFNCSYNEHFACHPESFPVVFTV